MQGMIRLYEIKGGKSILKYTVWNTLNMLNEPVMSREQVIQDAESRFKLTGRTHKVVQAGYPNYYADGVPF